MQNGTSKELFLKDLSRRQKWRDEVCRIQEILENERDEKQRRHKIVLDLIKGGFRHGENGENLHEEDETLSASLDHLDRRIQKMIEAVSKSDLKASELSEYLHALEVVEKGPPQGIVGEELPNIFV